MVLGSPGNTGQHFIEGLPDPVDSWCGDERIQLEEIKSLPLTIEKVICRRGIFEFQEDSFINLGIGLPMNAVSYTHLDVYKRQAKGSVSL